MILLDLLMKLTDFSLVTYAGLLQSFSPLKPRPQQAHVLLPQVFKHQLFIYILSSVNSKNGISVFF